MDGTTDLGARVAELERLLAAEAEVRQRLVQVVTRLGQPDGRDEVLRLIVSAAADLLHAETASLLLVHGATEDLRVAVASGSSEPDVTSSRIPAGRGIAGWTLRHREAVIVDDAASDERFYDDVDAASDFATTDLLAVPLIDHDRAVGVLEVVNKLDGPFTEADLELAAALAGLAVVALDRVAT